MPVFLWVCRSEFHWRHFLYAAIGVYREWIVPPEQLKSTSKGKKAQGNFLVMYKINIIQLIE